MFALCYAVLYCSSWCHCDVFVNVVLFLWPADLVIDALKSCEWSILVTPEIFCHCLLHVLFLPCLPRVVHTVINNLKDLNTANVQMCADKIGVILFKVYCGVSGFTFSYLSVHTKLSHILWKEKLWFQTQWWFPLSNPIVFIISGPECDDCWLTVARHKVFNSFILKT